MKRREFIINSAILAGGAALLGGCNKKELIKSENQITRRKYKDITVPPFGFRVHEASYEGKQY